VVVQGRALVTRDDDVLEVGVNESTFIPAGTVHRLENPGDDQLIIIEVQVGEYVGEDDIERLSDDWKR
jgi:mannose-6-phosphate isomerase-like protein (cupin superfamily)